MRKKILELLKGANGKFVSGGELAKNFSVSRTAIWKHINTLRNIGYKISGSEKNGYKLEDFPDLLAPEIIQYNLQTEVIGAGENYFYFDSVDSTNNFAKKIAAEGAADGTVIVAEER